MVLVASTLKPFVVGLVENLVVLLLKSDASSLSPTHPANRSAGTLDTWSKSGVLCRS
jgi:hypothetical protein